MAKKITTASKTIAASPSKAAAAPVATTVRNSAIPPKAQPAKKPAVAAAIGYDQVALTAYYLWKSGAPGNQEDHWFAAERQLRGI